MGIHKKTPESGFLTSLFDRLNEAKLGYAVLRGYEDLPNSSKGDIDMAVLPSDRDQIALIIQKVAVQYGGKVVVDYIGSGRFIRILGCHQSEWWGTAIDLFGHIEYRGVEYIRCQKIIERGKNHGSIRVADDEDAMIVALVKELISNGRSRKNYLSEARGIWVKRGDSCLHLLSETLSENTLSDLVGALSTEGDNLKSLVVSLRADVIRRGNYGLKIANLWSRLKRLWHTPGISVAVMGTDGAGKTTVIEAIRPVLEKALHSPIHYEHLRPNWIPRLGKIAGRNDTGQVVDNPHGQSPSGMLGSLVRLSYYAVDYYLGYWVKIHMMLAKGPRIALFDRYYYDFILDPIRMRIALPSWLIKLVMLGAPKPSLILCLGAEPEMIFARKPETSLQEVSRQIKDLRDMCHGNHRAVWVDTGAGIQASCDTALEAIQQAMFQKG